MPLLRLCQLLSIMSIKKICLLMLITSFFINTTLVIAPDSVSIDKKDFSMSTYVNKAGVGEKHKLYLMNNVDFLS